MFLIPIGPDTYEPYFEPDEVEEEAVDENAGWFSRQRRKLSDMLREAEAERHRRHEPSLDQVGVLARARKRVMRWIVERAAEQRLLWHLRTATAVQVAHRVRWAGQDLAAAAEAAIASVGALGGDGGLIAVDREGRIAMPYNSQGMKRAALHVDGRITSAAFED